MNRLDLRLLAAGCVLIISSPLFGYILGGKVTWSDADARQLQVASQEYHDAMHAHGGAAGDERMETAKQNYLVQQAALERTQYLGTRSQVWVRWLGVLSVASGVVVYFVKKLGEKE